MNKQFKEILVMNLMYNLLLAIVLSVVAQILSGGGVVWPGILLDVLIAYVLEMVIALVLPFSRWGMELAGKYAEPGTLKFRLLMTTGTAIPFAIAMCLGMSFIGTVLIGHQPASVWLMALAGMLPIFIVLGWILSFLFVSVFMGLAHKIVYGECLSYASSAKYSYKLWFLFINQ